MQPDGTTPLGAALEAQLAPRLLRLCIPKDVAGAVSSVLARQTINFPELAFLTRHIVRSASEFSGACFPV